MLGAPFLAPIASGVSYFYTGCPGVQISENLLVWERLCFVGMLWTKQWFAYEKWQLVVCSHRHSSACDGQTRLSLDCIVSEGLGSDTAVCILDLNFFHDHSVHFGLEFRCVSNILYHLSEVSFLALMITKLKYWSTSESFWSYFMSSNALSNVPNSQTRHNSGKNKQIHLSHKYVHLLSLINGKIVWALKDCFRSFFGTYNE